MSSPTVCATCGKEAEKKCTRCRMVVYCDATCQRADWKKHKKTCFPEGSTCTRCLKPINQSNPGHCEVPHPVHMLMDMGSSFGGGSSKWNFKCNACNRSFTKTSGANNYDSSLAPITVGPQFCFSGSHTTKPLEEGDERRVCNDILVLHAGPNLQAEIDSIPSRMPDIRVLTIKSTGFYDDTLTPTLNIRMPKLETLNLIDISFKKVHLDTTVTPLIEVLFMQNIPDECDLKILLPNLKSFTMHYYGPPNNDDWIHDMLQCSTKLETFDSYKLRVGPYLSFAGNEIRSIKLHRAELLQDLDVYAPKLESLNLQACYDLLGNVNIEETHPRFPTLPGRPSKFEVNLLNSCVSNLTDVSLRSHPRVSHYVGPDDGNDDYW